MSNDDPSPQNNGGERFYCLPHVPFYLDKIVVYETKTKFYLVGSNREKTQFRLLKLDRTDVDLSVTDDPVVYSRRQIQSLLTMVDEGNRSFGGLKKTCAALGIVGFIRFLQGYYLLLITRRRKVGELAGHSVYGISDTAYVYLPHPSLKPSASIKPSPQLDSTDEARYKGLFFGTDLTKDFYFSYTYDLTHTLQYNMVNNHTYVGNNNVHTSVVWNHFLMSELIDKTSKDTIWFLPIIHGYYRQAKFSLHGKTINLALIARRSRYFAGTRFLKRGINDHGQVANDVESEQIVFTYESPKINGTAANTTPHFSSFVQVRGSIPLYWSQDNSIYSPKPMIILQRRDPFYSSTILHFKDMFERYGNVIVLNLVKTEEKRPRETILGKELADAITFLNSLLPQHSQVDYIEFDFRRAHKSKTEDMMSQMEAISNVCIEKTGFFHTGIKLRCTSLDKYPMEDQLHWQQQKAIRTNCIDSLDRTNAAQFVIGKAALGHQLYAMGLIDRPVVQFDSDLLNMLTELYEGMGNQIALQYAGSELVNTINTYRSGNMLSQSRDLLTTMKRYYSNSFTDAEKQESINLLLGNFIPHQEKNTLWELESDHHLHNRNNPRKEHHLLANTNWWEVPLVNFEANNRKKPTPADLLEQHNHLFFQDFYQPHKLTSFDSLLKLPFNAPKVSTEHASPQPLNVSPTPRSPSTNNVNKGTHHWNDYVSLKDKQDYRDYVTLDRLFTLQPHSVDTQDYVQAVTNSKGKLPIPDDQQYDEYTSSYVSLDRLLPCESSDVTLFHSTVDYELKLSTQRHRSTNHHNVV